MTDIVKRLRSPEVFVDAGGMTSPVARQAADEIERLREEATRLEASLHQWVEDCATHLKTIGELESTLRRIGLPGKQIVYCRDGHEEAVLHARAALGDQA